MYFNALDDFECSFQNGNKQKFSCYVSQIDLQKKILIKNVHTSTI